MSKKSTTEEFIKRSVIIHNNKYDYSKVNYINNSTKVCILCPKHGEFYQAPSKHLSGQGCPICKNDMLISFNNKARLECARSFTEKAKNIHGNKYDYSKVEYIDSKKNVCIICPEHGEFYQTPHNHIKSKNPTGCPKCGINNRVNKRKDDDNKFIEKAKNIHGDKYDYSKVNYINSEIKVCIICREHGEFYQTPSKHLIGQGCSICANNVKYTNEIIIERAKEIHGDKYDYSKVEYINAFKKVCIICPKHGEFWQKPNDHLFNHGCPKCAITTNYSEKKLYDLLCKTFPNEEIVYQYRDKDIFGRQSIDMFFPKYKIGVEYQGEQHFIKTKYNKFGEILDKIKELDKRKFDICKNNNIKLFYFTYAKEKNVPSEYMDRIFMDEEELIDGLSNYIQSQRNASLSLH